MLSARIKAIFVLLFATIAIMAVTVKNTPPVSEYMQTGIRLSDLPDKECVAFMASKGAHMPAHYKQSLYFPAATKDYITSTGLGLECSKGGWYGKAVLGIPLKDSGNIGDASPRVHFYLQRNV